MRTVVKARTLGALLMEDEEGNDGKTLRTSIGDHRFEYYKRPEPLKWMKLKGGIDIDEAKSFIMPR